MMKVTFLVVLFVSSPAAFVHGFEGNEFDPLGKITDVQCTHDGLKAADKIVSLPGQPNGVMFNQYSGYVTVDPIAGRALFYYFTESQNPSSKPLVLWLNGGPGCSSVGNGAMMELGPFRVNSDGKTLSENKYAWNNVANILFLDSPAGVGFSYSNMTSDYGDARTAADSYTFLIKWLERFPKYKTRDFFIAGESYAGHYVAQLAQLILQNNKISKQTIINLRAIAMGNAYVDFETAYRGKFNFFWSHALISDEIHEGIVSNCNFSSPLSVLETCERYIDQVVAALANISSDDIYAPLCRSPSSNTASVSGFDPCSDKYVSSYLNNAEVQKSLHANVTGLPGPWISCRSLAIFWKDMPLTVLPIIRELMASGITVWLYGGDIDGEVPVTSTRYAINKLQVSVKTPWYPWYTKGEVGGYVVGYENLTFVTIRGAGHYVPSYQPARALAFFTTFLEGKLLPTL